MCTRVSTAKPKSTLTRLFPFFEAMRSYDRSHFKNDAAAGLTTAVMLIPQGMAYAMLAGLPPIVGLYASTLPILIYALLGTSRELAVGPVAMVSLMVASSLGPLAAAGSNEYVTLAFVLALLVGVVQALMGFLRAGFLVNFLSHPVVSGFTSAAALIIGLSQLKHLLGVNLPRSHHIHELLIGAVQRIGEVQPITVAIGVGSIVTLVLLKRYRPKWPRALIVVAVTTVLVYTLRLDQAGVAIVGEVPAGLPRPTMPTASWSELSSLLPTAVVISLVGFMESISVAKAFARRQRYAIDANRELIGLGMANVGAAFFGGYPVTGGFSRTAVNAQAGARSGIAGIITAATIVVTLLFFTDLFYFLPKAVLAAVVMTAVFGLVDLAEVRHLWKLDRAELALLGLTFAATLSVGIEAGIGIGVAASLLWFTYEATQPHSAVLGRVRGTQSYRNVDRYPEALRVDGVLILRFDASFFYGNVAFVKATINRALDERPDVHDVVIDAGGMNRLDSSALSALAEILDELDARGVSLSLAAVKGPVRDALAKAGLDDRLGDRAQYLSVHDAVTAVAA